MTWGRSLILEVLATRGTFGSSPMPGAVWVRSGRLTCVRCEFSQNIKLNALGSAIASDSGEVILKDCRFFGDYGTAVYVCAGRLIVSKCHFLQNEGGLAISDAMAEASDSVFSANGMGVGLLRDSMAKITACVFESNGQALGGESFVECHDCLFANNQGKPIDVLKATFYRCSFEANRAAPNASNGAIMVGQLVAERCSFIANTAHIGAVITCDDAEVSNCLFSGNQSRAWGPIVAIARSATIRNCTFAGNRLPCHAQHCSSIIESGFRGGLGTRIINSILTDNVLIGSMEATQTPYTGLGLSTTVSFSCIEDHGYLQAMNGNIRVDPCFARPGYWDPNGTPDDPYDDIWVDGDYHLKSQAGRWDPASQTWVKDDVTSPCIDAGDPTIPVVEEPFPNGGRINMGAYGGTQEASKSYFGEPVCETIVSGDIDGDCKVDLQDLAILASHWLEGW